MKATIKYKEQSAPILDIDEKGHVKFFFSAYDVMDSDNDITLKGAFARSINNNGNRIKHYFSHLRRETMPIGAIKEYFEGQIPGTELIGAGVVSKLNLDYPLAKDVYTTYKFLKENGTSFEHSFGAYPLNYTPNDKQGINVSEWKLLEVSTVGLGANEFTPLLEVKSLDKDTYFEAAYIALEKMINLPYSDETRGKIEKMLKLLSTYKTNEQQSSPDGPQDKAPEPPATEKQISISEIKKLIKF